MRKKGKIGSKRKEENVEKVNENPKQFHKLYKRTHN